MEIVCLGDSVTVMEARLEGQCRVESCVEDGMARLSLTEEVEHRPLESQNNEICSVCYEVPEELEEAIIPQCGHRFWYVQCP